jgi:hypothetical protein
MPNPIALLCAKHENLTINYFLIFLSYRYSNICDIRTTIVWKFVAIFGTFSLDHNTDYSMLLITQQRSLTIKDHKHYFNFNVDFTAKC